MKLVAMNWQPTDRQLRQFGCLCVVALPLIAWLWGAGGGVVGALAAIGGVLALTGVIAPQWLKPLFVALTLIATPIGLVVGELAMLLIYFGMFLPISLVFRLMGRDALQRRIDRDSKTYWQLKRQPVSVSSYYRQS